MTGLQGEIRTRILGTTAHIYVYPSQRDSISDYRQVVSRAEGVHGVLGAAPVVYNKGLIQSATGSAFVTLKGVDPGQEGKVTQLAAQVEEGSLARLAEGMETPAPILLGRGLADTLASGSATS